MMKERFSKLLLGEDMSGCGNGVCTALAISNAITNLCGMLCVYFLKCLDDGNYKFTTLAFFLLIVIALSFPNFQLPCLGNFGDWNLYLQRRRLCGEERWNGFFALVITLLS